MPEIPEPCELCTCFDAHKMPSLCTKHRGNPESLNWILLQKILETLEVMDSTLDRIYDSQRL